MEDYERIVVICMKKEAFSSVVIRLIHAK